MIIDVVCKTCQAALGLGILVGMVAGIMVMSFLGWLMNRERVRRW